MKIVKKLVKLPVDPAGATVELLFLLFASSEVLLVSLADGVSLLFSSRCA